MSRMIRKQIYIAPDQDTLLKARAREMGVTESELIRRGIDQVADMPISPMLRDPRAWEDELAFMQDRLKLVVPQTGRAWTREGLYDRPRRWHSD